MNQKPDCQHYKECVSTWAKPLPSSKAPRLVTFSPSLRLCPFVGDLEDSARQKAPAFALRQKGRASSTERLGTDTGQRAGPRDWWVGEWGESNCLCLSQATKSQVMSLPQPLQEILSFIQDIYTVQRDQFLPRS